VCGGDHGPLPPFFPPLLFPLLLAFSFSPVRFSLFGYCLHCIVARAVSSNLLLALEGLERSVVGRDPVRVDVLVAERVPDPAVDLHLQGAHFWRVQSGFVAPLEARSFAEDDRHIRARGPDQLFNHRPRLRLTVLNENLLGVLQGTIV
jgi:hypothetical protein